MFVCFLMFFYVVFCLFFCFVLFCFFLTFFAGFCEESDDIIDKMEQWRMFVFLCVCEMMKLLIFSILFIFFVK